MSTRLLWVFLLWVFLLWAAGCEQPAVAPDASAADSSSLTDVSSSGDSVTITVIGTNDHHGHIEWLPLLSGHVANLRSERARQGGAVVLVDGGDMFQGTLVSNVGEGAAVVRGYNALGYSAVTVGNHEFDFGPAGPRVTPLDPSDDARGALIARAMEADFPFLSANLHLRATSMSPPWSPIVPTARLEVADGVIIGLVGVTTSETLRTTLAGNVADLEVAPLAATIADYAAELRAAGAEIVVVAAHAGGRCSDFSDPTQILSCEPQEIFQVAQLLPPGSVDVIVAGHTHQGVAHFVNGIAIIESYAYGVAFGRVDLRFDRSSRRVTETVIHPPYFMCERTALDACVPRDYAGAPVVPDPAVTAVVDADLAEARALEARPIGVTVTSRFPNPFSEESALGNLLADLMREARSGDVGLMNGGGLRAPLEPGALTYGEFFVTFPFDNRFAVVTLSGAELADWVREHMRGSGNLFSFSGIRVAVACTAGALDVTITRDDGRAVGPAETLRLVTSDFLATGSSAVLSSLRDRGLVVVEEGELIREAMVAILAGRGGDLRPEDYLDGAAPRFSFPSRPSSCGL